MTSKIVQVTVLVAALGFAGTRASAEAAFVFKFDPGGCSFGWVDFGFNLIALPGEAGVFVDTNTGVLNLACHGQLPEDGSVPSVADVQAVLGAGPGALVLTVQNVPNGVCNVGGVLTTDFQEVVTPTGRVHLVCKVH